VPVTHFDFKVMLYSLLMDQKLVGDSNNLDLNAINPFSKYKSPTGRLSTANSGTWYQTTYDNCIKDNKDFLAPIIFAIDETKLQASSKNGCCPVMFTTTLFTQQL